MISKRLCGAITIGLFSLTMGYAQVPQPASRFAVVGAGGVRSRRPERLPVPETAPLPVPDNEKRPTDDAEERRKREEEKALVEKARVEQVAKQIEMGKPADGRARQPSAVFLETQARFSSRGETTPVAAHQTAQSPSAPPRTLTVAQQELLRLEVAECQRTGRTPDQLTPAEIALFKARAGVKP